jgi:hypothetical protein
MKVIDQIIRNRFLGSEIELHSSYEPIVRYINYRTPTAYGQVNFIDTGDVCEVSLDDGSFKETILYLLSEIQHDNNYSIRSQGELSDFIGMNEELVKTLYGGSAGQIFLLRRSDTGDLFVRKVAARFGVEGNGTPKLQAEIKFLLEINKRDECQALTGLYPRVIGHSETDKFIILDQEYIGEGKNVFTMLAEHKITSSEHVQYINSLLSSLIPNGYALNYRRVPEEESLEQLEDYYLRRAEGRIRFLQNSDNFDMDFPAAQTTTLPNLIQREEFKLNGISYTNPLTIFKMIKTDKKIADMLRPRTESFCAHGDMTFLNMVFDTINKAYRLIDNRGHIGNWDALYDFGKLKFTLSGFGKVMLKEFDLSENSSGTFTLKITGDKEGIKAIDSLNESFFDDIATNPEFQKLIQDEPYWRERILFAEAIHYLADIPHRLLLDQSPKHAVGVFLLGTKYLNELYDSFVKSDA